MIDSAAPVAELVERLRAMPLPGEPDGVGGLDLRPCPAASRTPPTARGSGAAWATRSPTRTWRSPRASTTTRPPGCGSRSPREPVATVHTAAAEVGQGLVTIEQQICRTELGVAGGRRAEGHPGRLRGVELGVAPDLRHRRRGQGRVRERPQAGADPRGDPAGHERRRAPARGRRRGRRDGAAVTLADLLGDDVVEDTVEWRHRPTYPIDPETGQGRAHVQYAFAAHRAVVDVDVELGLVKVVELACTQDVGRAMNPSAVMGQIQGGSTQGMGLALMEEIQIVDGRITNLSFTDYLIPTILDTPPMPIEVLEYADPHAPYGLRGVGEAPPSRRTGRRRGDPCRHRSGPAPGPDPARGRDAHPMTRPWLTAADLAEVERIMAPADAAGARLPLHPAERQPVHTVYVPADCGPGGARAARHGRPRRPRRARPRPRRAGPVVGADPTRWPRSGRCCSRCSSASRSRTSGSTSRTATAATPTTRRTPRPWRPCAPWGPTRRRTGRALQVPRGADPVRGLRTLDLVLGAALEAGLLPDGFRPRCPR